MDQQNPELIQNDVDGDTPDDVALLFAWANLQGTNYRDFSGARREARARKRHTDAEVQRQAAAQALAVAQQVAASTERAAREADEAARHKEAAAREGRLERSVTGREQVGALGVNARRAASELASQAAVQRLQAARCAEALVAAESTLRRESYELAEAEASALRQAKRYREGEIRRKELAGPQPSVESGGRMHDPYTLREIGGSLPERGLHQPITPELDMQPRRYRPTRDLRVTPTETSAAEEWLREPLPTATMPLAEIASRGDQSDAPLPGEPMITPAWIAAGVAQRGVPDTAVRAGRQAASEFASDRRERWGALGSIPGSDRPEYIADSTAVSRPANPPARMVLVWSLSGGSGRTSLVATLGRALGCTGERVLLTDLTMQALLPFYFGASQLQPGSVRTFAPPKGRLGAPVYLLSQRLDAELGKWAADKSLGVELVRVSRGLERVLVDAGSQSSATLARQFGSTDTLLLVPLSPDMNSIIGLPRLQDELAAMGGRSGRTPEAYFLLNHFNSHLPLHLHVREVLQKRLGDRLLLTAVRQSPAVGEALAEGMTVIDYAPQSPIAGDFLALSQWLGEVWPAVQPRPAAQEGGQ